MTTSRVLEGQKHTFVLLPVLREYESSLYYDVFRHGHKVARVSVEAVVQVALEDPRVDSIDLEEDMMHLFGTDDFTYVTREELSGVS